MGKTTKAEAAAAAAPEPATTLTVRFTRQDSPFLEGDVRTVPRLEAEKFVRQGAAVLVEEEG